MIYIAAVHVNPRKDFFKLLLKTTINNDSFENIDVLLTVWYKYMFVEAPPVTSGASTVEVPHYSTRLALSCDSKSAKGAPNSYDG